MPSDASSYEDEINILQRGLSRISIAAEGLDPGLDLHLTALRRGVQKKVPIAELQESIEAISESILDLDNNREQRVTSLADSVAAALQQINADKQLPKELRKLTKSLQKQLKKMRSVELDALEIVQGLCQLITPAPTSASGSEDEERPAWWQKMFSRDAEPEAVAGVETVAPSMEEPDAGTGEDLNAIKQALFALAEKLRRTEHDPQGWHVWQAHLTDMQALAELPGLVESLIALVLDSKHDSANQFEQFLLKLNQRLASFQDFLQADQQLREDESQAGERLDVAMRSHVDYVQSSLQQVSTLDEARTLIDQQLDTLLQQVSVYRESQHARQQAAQDQVVSLQEQLTQVTEQTERLQQMIDEQRSLALQDPLTELPNRQAYTNRIEQERARHIRHQRPLSMLVIDIDFFKRINDDFGHLAGDKVLKAVADRLRSRLRKEDFLCRYGGEEFVMVLPETAETQALELGEMLRKTIEKTAFHFRGEPVNVTISIGVAQFTKPESIEQVFERADSALYKAKQSGRNQVQLGKVPS